MKFAAGSDFSKGFYCITLKETGSVLVVEDPYFVREDNVICYMTGKRVTLDHIGDGGLPICIDHETIAVIDQISESRLNFMQELGRRRAQANDIRSCVELRQAVEAGRAIGVIVDPPEVNEAPEAPEGIVNGSGDNSSPANPEVPCPGPDVPIDKPFAAEIVPSGPTPIKMEQKVEEGDYEDGGIIEIPPPGK